MMKSTQKWVLKFAICFLLILCLCGGMVIVVDPYFHYHKPLPFLSYQISDQRYQNDGIVKHFDYDAVITGTSMTDNFKTSELDSLFGTDSIKIPFRGASFREVNDALETAVDYNKDITMIVRSLEGDHLWDDADALCYSEDSYPWYLYDSNPFNDVKYIFNKTVLLDIVWGTISDTLGGASTTSFDDYSSWGTGFTFGKEQLDLEYDRTYKVEQITAITEADYEQIGENISQNVTAIALENPQIQFYIFIPPYSIYYWDVLYQNGTLERQLDAEEYAVSLLLECENIRVFSFQDAPEIVCNLDNYRDIFHYSGEINSRILQAFESGDHEITQENYEEYCSNVREFYLNYDYDAMFE